jgi:hypothetical protein
MNTNLHEWFLEPQMDTDEHRCFLEPRNTQNNTEAAAPNAKYLVMNDELISIQHSSFITHNSPSGAWLKEIQR